MALDEFCECYGARIERSVDQIRDDIRQQLGEENLRKIVTWLAALGTVERLFLSKLGDAAKEVLLKIFTRVLGVTGAEALIAFAGGASWYLLIASFVDCADQL